jgi:hypothetical protein
MAKDQAFMARFGPACGKPFYAKKFIQKYPKYKFFEPYLENMPHRNIVKVKIDKYEGT